MERKVLKGVASRSIDRDMLIRGAIIALLDPTLISLGSGRWTFQVLLAIGLAMVFMVPLRRLPTWALLGPGLGWIVLGEIPTGWVWTPPGSSSLPAAFLVATFGSETRIGVRENGVLYVFGQTAMYFYVVHRLAFEVPATYFGLRGAWGIGATYLASAVLLVLLYPACRWYRTVKAAHPRSILEYL